MVSAAVQTRANARASDRQHVAALQVVACHLQEAQTGSAKWLDWSLSGSCMLCDLQGRQRCSALLNPLHLVPVVSGSPCLISYTPAALLSWRCNCWSLSPQLLLVNTWGPRLSAVAPPLGTQKQRQVGPDGCSRLHQRSHQVHC